MAKKRGLWANAVTDHVGGIPGAPGPWYFENMSILPREIKGVKILAGMESNVVNSSGELDIPYLKGDPLNWVVASMHEVTFNGTHGFDDCTSAWLGVAKNPLVNVIGHSGTPGFEYDYEKVIPIFGENGKLVEINNSSHRVRGIESVNNCKKIASICKKHCVPVIVNSDSHICSHVGCFDSALDMLESIDFPEELVINSAVNRFKKYLESYTNYFEME
jgi:putative hydrolase